MNRCRCAPRGYLRGVREREERWTGVYRYPATGVHTCSARDITHTMK